MRKTKNLNGIEIFCYEVEHLELDGAYSKKNHGLDNDLFYVKKETYYNIKHEKELKILLSYWVPNLNILKLVPQINCNYFKNKQLRTLRIQRPPRNKDFAYTRPVRLIILKFWFHSFYEIRLK